MAATSVCVAGLSSSFHGSWGASFANGGEEYRMLARSVPNVRVARPIRMQPMMGNINEGKGIFAPVVVLTRNIIGKKRFNQFRGKAIALHSQVSISLSFFYFHFLIVFLFLKY